MLSARPRRLRNSAQPRLTRGAVGDAAFLAQEREARTRMTLLVALIRKDTPGAACSSIFSLYASARVARGARARCFARKNVAKMLKKIAADAWERVGAQKAKKNAFRYRDSNPSLERERLIC